jgi:hypothetical protein
VKTDGGKSSSAEHHPGNRFFQAVVWLSEFIGEPGAKILIFQAA